MFANERELLSLYETSDFDSAVKMLREDARIAVVTRSEKGCVVVSRDAVETVTAEPVAQVTDVTGAGDLLPRDFWSGWRAARIIVPPRDWARSRPRKLFSTSAHALRCH